MAFFAPGRLMFPGNDLPCVDPGDPAPSCRACASRVASDVVGRRGDLCLFATLEGFGEQLEQLSCGSCACHGLVLWTGLIAGSISLPLNRDVNTCSNGEPP